jgi:hypothetical protein
MKNLLLSNFLLLLLSACNFSNYRSLKKVENVAVAIKPIFSDTGKTYLFNTSIDFLTKHYSGLLLVKPLSDKAGHYRVVFSTELGMKFFDFEYRDTSFEVHSCFKAINKPGLINTLRNDIGLLLMTDVSSRKAELLSKQKKEKLIYIYKYNNGKLHNYYFTDKKTSQLEKIESSSKVFKKTIALFTDYQLQVPYKIAIRHNFPLKIQFQLIDIKKNGFVTINNSEE